MAHRKFFGEDGVLWTVWTVQPVSTERRSGDERRTQPRADVDRRSLPIEMQDGWLAFQSDNEMRRLTPSRHDLEELSEAELCALVGKAISYGAPRRLIE